MTTAAPAKPQHLEALEKANRTRLDQDHLIRTLAGKDPLCDAGAPPMTPEDSAGMLAGMLEAEDAWLDETLGSLRATKALAAIRGIAHSRALMLLERSAQDGWPAPADKRIRDLTHRQRTALAATLRQYAGVRGRAGA